MVPNTELKENNVLCQKNLMNFWKEPAKKTNTVSLLEGLCLVYYFWHFLGKVKGNITIAIIILFGSAKVKRKTPYWVFFFVVNGYSLMGFDVQLKNSMCYAGYTSLPCKCLWK